MNLSLRKRVYLLFIENWGCTGFDLLQSDNREPYAESLTDDRKRHQKVNGNVEKSNSSVDVNGNIVLNMTFAEELELA